jgi:hypothetical protein
MSYYFSTRQLRRSAWSEHPLPNIFVQQKIGLFAKVWWARGAHPTRLGHWRFELAGLELGEFMKTLFEL